MDKSFIMRPNFLIRKLIKNIEFIFNFCLVNSKVFFLSMSLFKLTLYSHSILQTPYFIKILKFFNAITKKKFQ